MKVKEILNIVGGELLSGSYEMEVGEIKQNSKNIVKGDTFIAIVGENMDGHKYIQDARKNGATLAIISNKNSDIEGIDCILVEDAEKALYDIVEYKISMNNPVIIGITGSVGKTSTKEILNQILESKFKTFKTPKNFNTKRGIGLALSSYEDKFEILIAEMGMDSFGEISQVSTFIKPNIAIITNIGSSHIGNLGNRDNILKAKLEILDGLKDNGFLIVNNDSDKLAEYAEKEKQRQCDLDTLQPAENASKVKKVNIVTFGTKENSDILIKDVIPEEEGTKFTISIDGNESIFFINTFGIHNIYNIAPAIYIAKIFKMTDEEIQEELKNTKSTERRMDKFVTISNMIVYDDSYNASYESLVAALDTINAKKYYGRKVAVLGDVLELGDFAEEYHRKIGDKLIDSKYNLVITAGEMSKFICDEIEKRNNDLSDEEKIKIYHFENAEEINKNIDKILRVDDIVLIKASHGMNFKIIADKLREQEVEPAKYIEE